jgi:Ca2+-binding EF-hand superfamily protein
MTPRAKIHKSTTKTEFLVTLGDLFLSLDTDGNGELDLEEFRVFFEEAGITNEDPELAFAIFDADHSGMLSFQEFLEFFAYRGLAETDPRSYFFRAFKAFDFDKNGVLDSNELTRFLQITGVEDALSISLAMIKHAGGKPLTFEQFAEFLELPP